MKKKTALTIAVLLVLSAFAGCAPAQTAGTPSAAATTAEVSPAVSNGSSSETVVFTDSTGRNVEVPKNITKVAVSGPLAQIVLFALAPDMLAGIATEWDSTAKQYLDTKYYNLPLLGQLYGGKGQLNLETLLASGAQVVIDVGEPKSTIVADLDGLQQQTGLPFVHITATTQTMGGAYRKLGELLGMRDEAETLAVYCDDTYNHTIQIANGVSKVKLLYCLGDNGLNVIAKGSYHAEVIDMLSNNLAAVDNPTAKGTGNEVDMEQILNWNPDVILFAPDSIFDTVGLDETWKNAKAIADKKYYEVPNGPYNWMGFPPSVQRYLGMMWMSQLFYPDTAQYDLYAKVKEYYNLFYHCDITQQQYDALVANSIGTAK